MSKDQLSWDQLLSQPASSPENNSEESKASATAEAPAAPSLKDEPALAMKKTARKSSPKQTSSEQTSSKKTSNADAAPDAASSSASSSSTPADTGEPMYSKKNWGKLEFATPKESVTVQKTETTVSVQATPPPAVSEKVVEKIVEKVVETQVTAVSTRKKVTSVATASAPEDVAGESEAEPQVLTVSELNRHIRDILEGRFPLIWLKAEISNFKAHTSGHFYFSLKDSKAQINAVMFRGFNSQLRFRPEDGMEVLVRGKITVYEPRGNYQIFCEVMEPVGAGALQKAFEQLKAKLQREGLFDEARKRPLPTLPKHIAIVTSPTGAAIRDMLNVLGRRFKGAQITVIPCKVQGDQAPGEIIQAIRLANRLTDVDVMIVGRGGGSIEDLWAFNDEGVARAIASARVPVISAVGHEIDFTIADFVADLRAPTPSAAAELVVKNASDLAQQVAGLERALRFAALRKLNTERQAVTSVSRRLVDPQRRIQDAVLRCDELMHRLENEMFRSLQDRSVAIELLQQRLGTPLPKIEKHCQKVTSLEGRLRTGARNLLTRKQEALSRNMAVLDSLSPLRVLDRGFSMVTVDERIVTDATSLKVGQTIHVKMCQGAVDAQITKIEEKKKG